ncbi:zinc ribbon domain-containing protein [[Eubacterium] cellulosolvens]
MRTCSACGSRNADDAIFCSTCGATFSETRSVPVTQPAGGTTKPVPLVRTITPLAQTPPQFGAPMVMPRTQVTIGSCFYHPQLPAAYICIRCGRAICASCTKPYGQLTICPQCYWALAPRTGMTPQRG